MKKDKIISDKSGQIIYVESETEFSSKKEVREFLKTAEEIAETIRMRAGLCFNCEGILGK